MSKTITLSVSDELFVLMRRFPEVNFSQLARERISEYLAQVSEHRSPLAPDFLVLKDLVFAPSRIGIVHDRLEKNRVMMSDLAWVETVFDLDLFDSLARFLFLFAKMHPFEDGNKRTALVCVDVFLRLNGLKLALEQPLKKSTLDSKFLWQNANQQKTESDLRAFLVSHAVACSKPHSVAAALEASIAENKALLADLAL
ncbi:MAG: Fic family protein [Candidatus Diapherotrites archaeon]|nr:Fic family protein [Candidatus Diapherotrites archaeon]